MGSEKIVRSFRGVRRGALLGFGVAEHLAISDVARVFGLRTSAIRYYEQIGILPPATRKNGQRRYDNTVLFRLAVVQRAREAGFTLEEIRELFFGFPPGTPPPKRWHRLSQRKIAELRDRMKRLKLMEGLLKRVGELPLRRTRRMRQENSSERSRLSSEPFASLNPRFAKSPAHRGLRDVDLARCDAANVQRSTPNVEIRMETAPKKRAAWSQERRAERRKFRPAEVLLALSIHGRGHTADDLPRAMRSKPGVGNSKNYCVRFGWAGASPHHLDPEVVDRDVAGDLNGQLLDRVRLQLDPFGHVCGDPVGDVMFSQRR